MILKVSSFCFIQLRPEQGEYIVNEAFPNNSALCKAMNLLIVTHKLYWVYVAILNITVTRA